MWWLRHTHVCAQKEAPRPSASHTHTREGPKFRQKRAHPTWTARCKTLPRRGPLCAARRRRRGRRRRASAADHRVGHSGCVWRGFQRCPAGGGPTAAAPPLVGSGAAALGALNADARAQMRRSAAAFKLRQQRIRERTAEASTAEAAYMDPADQWGSCLRAATSGRRLASAAASRRSGCGTRTRRRAACSNGRGQRRRRQHHPPAPVVDPRPLGRRAHRVAARGGGGRDVDDAVAEEGGGDARVQAARVHSEGAAAAAAADSSADPTRATAARPRRRRGGRLLEKLSKDTFDAAA